MAQRGLGRLRATRSPQSPPIFLHIGAMKTGTTYLQQLMGANRDALAKAGLLFPGESWTDHALATRDVMTPPSPDRPPRAHDARYAGSWQRLTDEMLAHRGAGSVLSHEFVSFATPAQAQRIVESFAGREVQVILTVRDAARLIPAQWQTNCRNGGKLSFAEFVRGIRRGVDGSPQAGRPARIFERTQGLPRMLDVWVPLVGADRVHVVTVPPRGAPPDLLWNRFASVLGIDPAVCAPGFDYVNPSLGFASTELLRRINRQLGRIDKPVYDVVVKGPLARYILGSRSHLERSITLHRSGLVTAVRWNRRVRSAIVTTGVDVVGDLEDLPTRAPSPAVPRSLSRPQAQELVDAAATARNGLIELHASFSRGEYPTRPPAADPAPPPAPGDPPGSAEVRAAIHEVTSLVRDCFAVVASDPTAYEPLRTRF